MTVFTAAKKHLADIVANVALEKIGSKFTELSGGNDSAMAMRIISHYAANCGKIDDLTTWVRQLSMRFAPEVLDREHFYEMATKDPIFMNHIKQDLVRIPQMRKKTFVECGLHGSCFEIVGDVLNVTVRCERCRTPFTRNREVGEGTAKMELFTDGATIDRTGSEYDRESEDETDSDARDTVTQKQIAWDVGERSARGWLSIGGL